MKYLAKILIVLLGISFTSAAFATVAYGPVRDSNTAIISPAELTYVASIAASDSFIITERTPDGYKVDGNWTVNISNFVDQGPSGIVNFSIKFDASGKTVTANAPVNTGLGTVLIPSSGNTLLTNVSALTAPTIYVGKGNGELVLTWDPVPNAVSYRLYRGEVANTGYFRKISNNAASPYTDSGLDIAKTYYYVLIAVDGSGATSPHSNYISEVPNGSAFSVTALTISPTSATLFDGASQAFTARATFSNGVQSNVTASYDVNLPLGTISGNTYSAPNPVAVDNTPVTVTATYLTRTAQATVMLRKKTVTSISISPASATLYDGQNQVFTVNANYNDGTSSPIATLPTILSRSGSGDISGYTYAAPGTIGADETVTINANLEGKTAAPATVLLKKKALDSISISPNGAVLNQGDTQPFTVYANFNGSRDATVNSSDIDWNTGVGTITSGGVLSSTQGGNGKVTATYTYDVVTKSAFANVLIGYSQMFLRVESNKANIYAKDTAGNEFPVISYDSVAFTASGSPDGNRVGLVDGTLTEGSKEGPYAVSATVSIAGRTFTPNGVWNINKGAPVAKVLIGTTQVSNDNIIDTKPSFTINVTDGNGVKSVRLYVDGTEITAPALTLRANDAASTSVTATYAVSTALTAGSHYLRVVTQDNLGTESTVDITGLKVYDALAVQGIPKNYPNPFKPSSGVGTKIRYTLTQAADIKLMIYDLSGRPVYTVLYPRDPNGTSQGGHAGDNDVDFDGKDFNGKLLPNGVYTYFITSAGKVLASGEISVYD